MGEVTKEIDIALKNTVHLLSTISPERIRDEFLKGIASAKSVKHFLGLLNKYKLFDWIFKGLKYTQEFIEDRDPMIVIATLLKHNTPDVIGKALNKLTYMETEIRGIKFLVALQHLTPENAITMKKIEKTARVNPEQMRDFGTRCGLDAHLLSTFIKFQLTVRGDAVSAEFNIPEGPELGKRITSIEHENFLKLLG